ncbi:MAG: bifunctional lytic transglycosylase/C40 family peptidase [Lactococcus cremoris]
MKKIYFSKWFAYGLLGLFVILMLISALFSKNNSDKQNEFGNAGAGSIPQAVLQYKEEIFSELKKHGREGDINLLLAIVTQESGGTASLDIMQASESMGLPPNTIQDPIVSIKVGVQYFNSVMDSSEEKGVDVDTAIQSYNMGAGYIDFVASNGGEHSLELAQQFSEKMKNKMGWAVYGDPNYVAHVKQHLASSSENDDGNGSVVSTSGEFAEFKGYFEQFEGMPYVFGGASPATSFDCSGLWQYAFKSIGINLPRTAQQQYDYAQEISEKDVKQGDLVFFQGTYDTSDYITHVGIYVGNNTMYHAGDPLQYADLTQTYWQQHFVGYGRVTNFN